MFISLEYRYAFVHIPKTAGEWLFHMLNDAAWKDNTLSIAFWGQDHTRNIDATHLYQDILYDYVSPVLYKECVSFCVVRNPYNRFYSACGDLPSKTAYSKSVAHRQPNAERFWIHKYPAYEAPHKQDVVAKAKRLFERFCDLVDEHNIVNDTITKHNIHLVPQHKFVYRTVTPTRTEKNVQCVLRYEQLGADLTRLFNQYGFPHSQRPRKHYNGSYKIRFDTADVQRNQQSYLQYYTAKTIALVNRLYAEDFERFGFDKLDPAQFTTLDKRVVRVANRRRAQHISKHTSQHTSKHTSKKRSVGVRTKGKRKTRRKHRGIKT